MVGRRSPAALYDYGLATYDEADTFRHADSEGFVRIYGLGVKTWAQRQGCQRRERAAVMTLWSGRIQSSMNQTLWDLSESYSFDHVLYAYDLAGTRAHVRGLVHADLLSADEGVILLAALDTIESEFETDAFITVASDEDVHTGN